MDLLLELPAQASRVIVLPFFHQANVHLVGRLRCTPI